MEVGQPFPELYKGVPDLAPAIYERGAMRIFLNIYKRNEFVGFVHSSNMVDRPPGAAGGARWNCTRARTSPAPPQKVGVQGGA